MSEFAGKASSQWRDSSASGGGGSKDMSWGDMAEAMEAKLEAQEDEPAAQGGADTAAAAAAVAGSLSQLGVSGAPAAGSPGKPAAADAAQAAAQEPAAGEAVDHSALVSSIAKKFLVDIEASDLEVQQRDKSSPLYSATTFEELGHMTNTRPM